jgi:SRSO17 transposase
VTEVLILDDSVDLTKGDHSIAAQRQYSGTAARVENAH